MATVYLWVWKTALGNMSDLCASCCCLSVRVSEGQVQLLQVRGSRSHQKNDDVVVDSGDGDVVDDDDDNK